MGSPPNRGGAPNDKEMVAARHDRFSALGIFLGQIGGQVATVVQFGYRGTLRPAPLSSWVLAILALAVGGLVLRLWPIRTLGRFFTSTVQVAPDQKVVETGPYRLLRHPSYRGALVTACGVVLTMLSPLGIALVLLLALPAYLHRIVVEEVALVEGLGDA